MAYRRREKGILFFRSLCKIVIEYMARTVEPLPRLALFGSIAEVIGRFWRFLPAQELPKIGPFAFEIGEPDCKQVTGASNAGKPPCIYAGIRGEF